MAVCGRVPFPGHHPGRLHGDGHSLGAVQAVGGVVEDPAGAQAQGQLVGGPHAPAREPGLVVGVLGGLCAALGRDGDEGLGGGAGRDRRRGLLVVGRVGDGWGKAEDTGASVRAVDGGISLAALAWRGPASSLRRR